MKELLFWALNLHPLTATIISFVVVLAAFFVTMVITDKLKAKDPIRDALLALAIAFVFLVMPVQWVCLEASTKAAPTWVLHELTIGQLIETNEHAPIKSGLSEMESMLKDTSIVPATAIYLYKWGCEDCAQVYPQTINTLKQLPLTMRYVPSTSDVGQQIVQEFGIDEVPALLLIDYDRTMTIDLQTETDPVAAVIRFLNDDAPSSGIKEASS